MERDKKQHLVVGFLISFIIGFLLIKFTPLTEAAAILVGLGLSVGAGWAKEYIYDKARPSKHVVDKKDFKVTALGGVIGAVVLSAIHLFLRG